MQAGIERHQSITEEVSNQFRLLQDEVSVKIVQIHAGSNSVCYCDVSSETHHKTLPSEVNIQRKFKAKFVTKHHNWLVGQQMEF